MKKIVLTLAILSLFNLQVCAAQDTEAYAQAYAGEDGASAYAQAGDSEAYAGTDTVSVSITTDTQSDTQTVYIPAAPQTPEHTAQPAVRAAAQIASSDNASQAENTPAPQTVADLGTKVDTISQLSDDTLKQTDIIESQNARVLNLFLITIGALMLIIVLSVILLIWQKKIKDKLRQNI